jgi:2-dehydro-3-deoxygalactonokinase
MNAIALDWGSSRLRAYALDERGGILDTREAHTGVFAVEQHAFEETLRALIGDWLDDNPKAEVIAAGMIGSANGWREAPYVATAASAEALRAQCVRVPFVQSLHRLTIVPGVRHGSGATTDVMRGEETQVFGALGESNDGVFCLPGTHCKWVVVRHREIVALRTHFTGELYQWLTEKSSVSSAVARDAAFDGAAFDDGVKRARAEPAGLLNHLFSLRAVVVSRERSPQWAINAAQGLLIGHDVTNGLKYLRSNDLAAAQVRIVGGTALTQAYARALGLHSVGVEQISGDVTVKGLHRILHRAV